jgi:hypothetical protein
MVWQVVSCSGAPFALRLASQPTSTSSTNLPRTLIRSSGWWHVGLLLVVAQLSIRRWRVRFRHPHLVFKIKKKSCCFVFLIVDKGCACLTPTT